MQYKLYILRYPKSEALSVFSIIMDINFGFVSLSFRCCYNEILPKNSTRKTSNFLWEHKLKGGFQHSPQTQIIIIKGSQEG